VRDEVLTRVLGVLRGLAMAGLGIGSIVAPALVAGLGTRGALVATGCFLPLVVAVAWRSLGSIDLVALPPAPGLAGLGGVALFAPLSVAAKEQLAASLIPLAAPAGAAIISEGDVGDRFYVVAQGRVEVTKGGRSVETHGPGGYFGEIALLRGVPRTATVTALEDVQLYA